MERRGGLWRLCFPADAAGGNRGCLPDVRCAKRKAPSAALPANLQRGIALHRHAVPLHAIYRGAEPDPKAAHRGCRYRPGDLLQGTSIFLHSPHGLTAKNLRTAFAGEAGARSKYTFFASKAKKEGFEQIAALFLKTADNETLRSARRTTDTTCNNKQHIAIGGQAAAATRRIEKCPLCQKRRRVRPVIEK